MKNLFFKLIVIFLFVFNIEFSKDLIGFNKLINWKIKNIKNNSIIKFKINDYKWQYIWNNNSKELGEISENYFFIKIQNQLIKVYLPKNIKWQILMNNFNQNGQFRYSINNQDYILQLPFNNNDNSVFLENNSKFPYYEDNLNFFNCITENVNSDITKYKFSDKNQKYSLDIEWNFSTKTIENYILKDDKFTYQENVKKNTNLNLNNYPKNMSVFANNKFLNIMNLLANKFSKNIEVFITDSYDLEIKDNIPNIEKIINEIKTNKKYILIMIPMGLFAAVHKESINRYHIFPVGLLYENFNNIWILKKIINTNSCINQFLFLNYRWNDIITSILKNSQNNLNKNIKKNININNKIIDNFSFYTNGNTYNNMTDFIQTRQSGPNSCYSTTYKDIMRIIKYCENIIEKKYHVFEDNLLSIKDLCQQIFIEQNYNDFDSQQLKNFIKSALFEYQSNINFHQLNENLIINVNIEGPKSLGPLKDEENVLYNKSNIENLRKQYHIFFIKINNDIYCYLIYRGQEQSLDNQRYYDNIIEVIKEMYPYWKIHSMEFIPLEDFNKNHSNIIIKILFKFLTSNVSLPAIYDSLKELSGFLNPPIKKNQYSCRLYLGQLNKSIIPDYKWDLLFHLFFLNSKYIGDNKEKIFNILLKIIEDNILT
jgi:hypothetical protein